MKKALLLAFCITFLAGCGASTPNVMATNDNFMIVNATAEDNYTTLAAMYMQDERKASVLKRYNPGIKVENNSKIAIPLKNFNQAGVFVNGYQRIPILCYHQFSADGKGSSMVIPGKAFEQQMAYLKDNGYQVISLEEVNEFLSGNTALPDKSVVITIDDGYKSFYSVAYPILKKYGFKSTMFIYPDFIGAGLALKWKQVNTLNDDPLVDIQSHSKSHSSLSIKPAGEKKQDYLKRLKVEVGGTDKILTRRIGNAAKHFAYPYGNSSNELIELLQEDDYQLALTVKQGGNGSFASPYLLRRTIIYGEDNLNTFKRRLDVFRKAKLK
jgi:peptidoglycan/xylan/chitin deacetylase (PgdA/CDA1 family)